MAHATDAGDGGDDMHTPTIAVGDDVHRRKRKPAKAGVTYYLGLVPGFAYVLGLFVIVALTVGDMRAVLVALGPFKISWVEIILLLSAIVACAEILKVSEPGVNNTGEVIWMGAIALLQFGLIVASLYDGKFAMFKTTESLMMLVINGVQTIVAFHINARSLQRTIASGPVVG